MKKIGYEEFEQLFISGEIGRKSKQELRQALAACDDLLWAMEEVLENSHVTREETVNLHHKIKQCETFCVKLEEEIIHRDENA